MQSSAHFPESTRGSMATPISPGRVLLIAAGVVLCILVLKAQKKEWHTMKKILTASICLLLLFCLTTPAFAADLTVPFTSDSLPEVGGTLTVDKEALMNNGSITSEMYNALLEGNVIYSWYRNDILVVI